MAYLKRYSILLFLFIFQLAAFGQGINNNWLIGSNVQFIDSNTTSKLCKINFYNGSAQVLPDIRKMKFDGTEANISDASGNLLMSSNGFWIADATGDTMLNGSGLAFDTYFNANIPYGLPWIACNIIIPFPADSTKYILFHQMGAAFLPGGIKLFYTVIDKSLNNGLGAVISKNNLLLTVINSSGGIGACKHANGRDWWVVVTQDSSNVVYKILVTPTGISAINPQVFSTILTNYSTGTQPAFSPDGSHFAFTTASGGYPSINFVRLFDFDRCTGTLSNLKSIFVKDSVQTGSLYFSGNSKMLYFASSMHVYQQNIDSLGAIPSDKLVATYDGFLISGLVPTNFDQMYRANDGKIYITSTSTVPYLHRINYPDSEDTLCDIQQHAVQLPSYNWGTVPNHPNYFLGPMENSVCDSLSHTSSLTKSESILKVFPTPSIDGVFGISYVLAQNKTGLLQIFNVNGKKVHEQRLPQWSTFQQIEVPKMTNGIYSLRLQSGDSVRRAKVILQRE